MNYKTLENTWINSQKIEYYDKPQFERIYVSLTSIFKNQDFLLKTLKSILKQTKKPDKIFLHLSEEPYILDSGFKNRVITNSALLRLLQNNQNNIEVVWVKNTGSYRKLLPLLKEKWEEDCIIITIDDDSIYDHQLIENLVKDYYHHKCVISYKGFTPNIAGDQWLNFKYEDPGHILEKLSLYNFPIGKGGILYKPSFFHKTKDLIFDETIYLDLASKQDDIWFYFIRILNNIKCYIDREQKWHEGKEITSKGLYTHFNNHHVNGLTNRVFRNVYLKLSKLKF
jgi:hypothetical protein